MRFLNKEQKEKIGFEYILNCINTVTNVGTELKYNARPFTIHNFDLLNKELNNISYTVNINDLKEAKEISEKLKD